MEETQGLPRFLAPGPLREGRVVALPPQQSRHMVRVLRIGEGDRVRLFTRGGEEAVGRVEHADPGAARVRVAGRIQTPPGPACRITVGFAPPPGQRGDTLVEKATELGADVLQPIICQRSQGFRAEAARRRNDRWQRKAREAARQSRRPGVPAVRRPVPFEQFVRSAPEGLRLLALTPASRSGWEVLESQPSERPSSLCLAVGPAGGFTRRETELARDAGFVPVSLGPNVLRVETAALSLLAACVLWLAAGGV